MDKPQTTILWEQFNAEADIERMLQHHGWTRVRERGDRVDYVRPGKAARDGISANWHNTRRLLYVFTDATAFEADKAYNAAQVFNVLECGGNMHSAAQKLIELGYYTPKELPITGRIHLDF
jgi:hypothetical protein